MSLVTYSRIFQTRGTVLHLHKNQTVSQFLPGTGIFCVCFTLRCNKWDDGQKLFKDIKHIFKSMLKWEVILIILSSSSTSQFSPPLIILLPFSKINEYIFKEIKIHHCRLTEVSYRRLSAVLYLYYYSQNHWPRNSLLFFFFFALSTFQSAD